MGERTEARFDLRNPFGADAARYPRQLQGQATRPFHDIRAIRTSRYALNREERTEQLTGLTLDRLRETGSPTARRGS